MAEKENLTIVEEDEEVMIRKSQSDSGAFKPLYDKYFKRIFLFILHRVGDKAQTADITSQVFLNALINVKKFQFRGVPFSAWLFRIAINECANFFRRNKQYRYVTIEDTAVAQLHEEVMSNSHPEDLYEELPRILQKLTEDELVLIELRFFDQRSFKEVADILGITENNAKVRTYRTLNKMKEFFLKKL